MWKANVTRITKLGKTSFTQRQRLVMSSYRLGRCLNKIFRDVIDDVYEI